MTRNKTLRAIAGLGVAAVLVGGAAVAGTYAQQTTPGRGGRALLQAGKLRKGPQAALRLGLGQLGLSAEQKQKIKDILRAHKDQSQALRTEIGPARRALADAIATGDETAIRAAAAKVAAGQADAAVLAGKVRAGIFSVLTPEQQQKAQAMKAQARQRLGRLQALRKNRLQTLRKKLGSF